MARGSKKVASVIKLAIEAGKANPSPPVGPALGAAGVNIMEFCKQYNAATQDKVGETVPVDITVFEDRSFTFVMKTAPTSMLVLKAAGLKGGSGEPQKVVTSITEEQLEEIAKIKMPDLNCTKLESAKRVVHGTCRNMGVAVENRRHRGDPSIMTSTAEVVEEEQAQEEAAAAPTAEELDAAADAAEAEYRGEDEGDEAGGEGEGAEKGKEAVAA